MQSASFDLEKFSSRNEEKKKSREKKCVKQKREKKQRNNTDYRTLANSISYKLSSKISHIVNAIVLFFLYRHTNSTASDSN